MPLPKIDLLVVLDQIRDQGMGTICACEAAGAEAVLLPSGHRSLFAKVVRAGMGAHFRFVYMSLPWDGIAALSTGLPAYHADMDGKQSCWQADFAPGFADRRRAQGISPEGQKLATTSVHIPGKVDQSLNAAISASVLRFEVMRQRTHNTNSN